MHSRRVAAAVLATVVMASPAAAQQARSNTSKFFAALELGGSSIRSDEFGGESESESGGGGTLRIGYGFTPKFSIFLEGAAATLDTDSGDWTLGHADLGVRFHFADEARAWIPFLEAAFTYRSIRQDGAIILDDQGNTLQGDFELSGGAFSIGGGLLYFFNAKWALSTGVKFTSGEFDTVRLNNVSVTCCEIDATSTRFSIGLSWFPMSRR